MWGIVCLLLVVFWVRSYTIVDMGSMNFSSTWGGAVSSDSGEVGSSVVHLNGEVLDDWLFTIPYWLLLILSAIAGALSWVPWSKRFTLRTVLIAMTLVAVVLGLIVYASSFRQGLFGMPA